MNFTELEVIRQEKHLELQMEKFLQFLNRDSKKVKTDKIRDVNYIPVSEIEVQLDTMFFGHWQTKNLSMTAVGNELVCTLELGVLNPITKEWIWRGGVGACMIRQTKGAKNSDIDAKIKNGLEMDAPHAKASAFKNAALSLGNLFGRNLRRKDEDISTYAPIITKMLEPKNLSPNEIGQAAEHYLECGNLDDLKKFRIISDEQEKNIKELAQTLANE